jgi:hypothetical protein
VRWRLYLTVLRESALVASALISPWCRKDTNSEQRSLHATALSDVRRRTREALHIRIGVAFIRNRHKGTTMNLTFDLLNRCRHPPTKSLRISRAGDGQKGARHGSHPFGSLATQAAQA